MKILLQKNPVMAGLSSKIRSDYPAGKFLPDSMKRSGKSGSGRTLKMLIRYTPSINEAICACLVRDLENSWKLEFRVLPVDVGCFEEALSEYSLFLEL